MKLLRLIVNNIGVVTVIVICAGTLLAYLFVPVKPEDIGAFGLSYDQSRLFNSLMVGLVLPALYIPTALVLRGYINNPVLFDISD